MHYVLVKNQLLCATLSATESVLTLTVACSAHRGKVKTTENPCIDGLVLPKKNEMTHAANDIFIVDPDSRMTIIIATDCVRGNTCCSPEA